jgi:hypothetical protein
LYSDSEGINISAGKETSIALNKVVAVSLKKPYSNCDIDMETDTSKIESVYFQIFKQLNLTYRQVDCLDLCYQMALIKHCQCVDIDINFFNLFDVDIQMFDYCDLKDNRCIENVSENLYEKCGTECPMECTKISFTYTTSFCNYPSNTRLKYLMKRANGKHINKIS